MKRDEGLLVLLMLEQLAKIGDLDLVDVLSREVNVIVRRGVGRTLAD